VTSTGFFREALAADMVRGANGKPKYEAAAPLIVLQGIVSDPASGRRVSQAAVYGVDDRFWTFHHVDLQGPADRGAYVSRALADDLGFARATVVEAYAQLQAEGYLVSRGGSATRVARAAARTSSRSRKG
jgi:hypothetical protein